MIKMLVGLKGSGKTKTLIDEVKKASEASTGSVVCVEYGRNLSYNIGYDVRLVDAKEYAVKDATVGMFTERIFNTVYHKEERLMQ